MRFAEDGDDEKFLRMWNAEVIKMQSVLSSSSSPASKQSVSFVASSALSSSKPRRASFDASATTQSSNNSAARVHSRSEGSEASLQEVVRGTSFVSSITSFDESYQRESLSSLSDDQIDDEIVPQGDGAQREMSEEEENQKQDKEEEEEVESLTDFPDDEIRAQEMIKLFEKLERLEQSLMQSDDELSDNGFEENASRIQRNLDLLLAKLSPMEASLGPVLSSTQRKSNGVLLSQLSLFFALFFLVIALFAAVAGFA